MESVRGGRSCEWSGRRDNSRQKKKPPVPAPGSFRYNDVSSRDSLARLAYWIRNRKTSPAPVLATKKKKTTPSVYVTPEPQTHLAASGGTGVIKGGGPGKKSHREHEEF